MCEAEPVQRARNAARPPPELVMKRIELLWFHGCPNHEAARAMIDEAVTELWTEARVITIEVPDEEAGERTRFPGSPTIRVDGIDIDPGFEDCEDCTPRCRVYATSAGLRGLPEREWLMTVLRAAE